MEFERLYAMIVYFLSLLFTIILCFLYIKTKGERVTLDNKRLSSLFAVLSIVPLTLVSGLRYGVGADFFTYKTYFDAIAGNGTYFGVETERGYYLLNKIVAFFTNNSVYLFITVSAIIISFFFSRIFEASVEPVMSVFLFVTLGFYFYAMNGQRQFIAIAICFWATRYIEKEQFWRYLLCIVAAMLFHFSAFIMLFVYFLRKKIPIPFWLLIITISLMAVSIYDKVLMFLINTFYPQYNNEHFLNAFFNIEVSYFNILLFGILSVACVFYKNKLVKDSCFNIFYINVTLICFTLYVTGFWLGSMLTRLLQYISTLTILTIPKIIKCEPKGKVKFIMKLVTYALSITFLIMMLSKEANTLNRYIPYISVFS